MGYEVMRRRVYSKGERYCNGSGLALLKGTLAEAETAFDDLARGDAGYPAACFLIDLQADKVLRSTGGLTLAEVDRRMWAATKEAA